MESDEKFLAEIGWLLIHSKCRFTDVNLRSDWIVRKQRVLRQLREEGVIEDAGR